MALTLTRTTGTCDARSLREEQWSHTKLYPSASAFRAWLETQGYSRRTIDDYCRYTIPHGALRYPDKDLRDLSSDDMSVILSAYVQGSRKPATSIKPRRAAWESFFRWARLTGRLDANPLDRIPKPRRRLQQHSGLQVLEDAHLEALLTLPPLVDRVPMMFMALCGLRKSELIGLRAKHCRPETGQVMVLDGKGSKHRTVEMEDRMVKALAELFLLERLADDDYILWTRRGGHSTNRDRPRSQSTFNVWYYSVLDVAEIPYEKGRTKDDRYGNPHMLRHTCATRWLRMGVPLQVVSRMLGHASIQTTADIYGHLDTTDQARELVRLGLRAG